MGFDRDGKFADLAAKLAAGPPKKPVGLVKKEAYGYEEAKQEGFVAGASGEDGKGVGDVMKEALGVPKRE